MSCAEAHGLRQMQASSEVIPEATKKEVIEGLGEVFIMDRGESKALMLRIY
jgi:hypothetical protein